jgi:hypothetical protein
MPPVAPGKIKASHTPRDKASVDADRKSEVRAAERKELLKENTWVG